MNDRFDPKAFPKPKTLSPTDKTEAPATDTFNPAAIKQQMADKEADAKAEEIALAERPLGKVKTWSFSRLMQYENCPYSIYLKNVEKAPDPSGPAAERGSLVHEHIENYIQCEHDDIRGFVMPKGMKAIDLNPFIPLIDKLRKGFEEDRVEVEGDWGFTRDWHQTGFFANDVWARVKLDAVEFEDETSAKAYDWKGLALDTPLPTPDGWTTMGDVQEGDVLFAEDGKRCTVTGKSDVHHRNCYEVKFQDNSSVIADDEHLWETCQHGVISTKKLAELRNDNTPVAMPVARPIDTDYKPLPIDPYLLGLWLADGKHTSGEISKPDQEVWDRIEMHGYGLGTIGRDSIDSNKCITRTVIGLRAHLNHIGLLGNKHIPTRYLRASYPQRLDLLRGLMDGDGNANATRGQAIFTTTDKQLSDQVMELLASLGQRPLQSTVTAKGFGKTVIAYPISFRPTNELVPFYLTRKAKPLERIGDGRSKERRVTSVEKVDTVPTQCIAVDSPSRTYLCTKNMIVTHNTGRKFGNELKHNQQGMVYAIATFMRYPKLQFVETSFEYLDQNDRMGNKYTRDRAMLLKPMIDKRANRLTTATEFPPKPSMMACKWCAFAKPQEGEELPRCAYAYQEI